MSDLSYELKQQLFIEAYWVLKQPGTSQLVNWDVFARKAAEIGLHYDLRLGLMTATLWDTIKPLLKEPTGSHD